MELSPRDFADTTILTPAARIDHATADDFRQALLAALGRRPGGGFVVLDLGAVNYVASTGLRALLVGAKQLKAQGGSLALAALQPTVKEVLTSRGSRRCSRRSRRWARR